MLLKVVVVSVDETPAHEAGSQGIEVTGLAEQRLSVGISYLAVDAYYFKEKCVSPVTTAEFLVVMPRVQRKRKVSIALLYSTHTALDAMTLVSHYQARFQIEYIFRDAKQ